MAADEMTQTEPSDPAEVPGPRPGERWEGDRRTIYMRMADILAELPAIGKTSYNEQQKFHFRGHDAVLNALNPLLARHGVFVVPEVLERVSGERTTGNNKTMYEVNLLMRFTFYGILGDSVVASTWGEGTDMGDKATMKAATMAFKAALAQAFVVSTEEASYDTDGQTNEETTRGGAQSPRGGQQRREPVFVPAKTWDELRGRLVALGIPVDDGTEWMKQAFAAAEISLETDDGKRAAFMGANKLLLDLERRGSVEAEADPRTVVRALVVKAYGVTVDGPEWRLSVGEEDRLSKEQLVGAALANQTPADGEDDSIPF